MFDRILALFDKKSSVTKLPPAESRFALGALLVRTAKADHAYLFEEVEQIDRVLALRNGIGPVDAAKMRAQCELLEEKLPQTEELTRILNAAIGANEREATVAALWSVVFADGVEHESEDGVVAEITGLLGVDAATCRQIRDREAAKLPPRRD